MSDERETEASTAEATRIPFFARALFGAALIVHLGFLLAGQTVMAASVLFGALTSALNLLALSAIVRGLVKKATGASGGGLAVALAPVKFVGVIAVVLFLLTRTWIHPVAFMLAHGAVLFGVVGWVAMAGRTDDEPG